jgi:hypothetical protein
MTVVADPSAWLLTGAAYSGTVDLEAISDASEKNTSTARPGNQPHRCKRLGDNGARARQPGPQILERLKKGRHD